MPDHTYFAVLQYAGGAFAGWQRQANDRTVQGELEHTLARLAGRRVTVHAAGRTDAGVHALGQVVSFRLHRAWHPSALLDALRALVPDDVWVARLGAAPDGFHARKHARARRYRYVVGCDPAASSPFRRPYEWALGVPLDRALLEEAAHRLAGVHDFRALSTVGQLKPHYRCRVIVSEWQVRPDDQGYIFTIEADRFLHRMVRFLVGLQVDVARGRRSMDDVDHLLAAASNRAASPPAPPHGLYLIGARYPQLDEGTDQ
jgi:tRNA pseudouridine38-40 synthase